ncbi:ABC transporter substrate-binding protein [Halorussus sp. AFM4]|uniref:ABC transporter substrate-binding protein n=1 Tax=Halorussus sp. AFM4 TaxID=3421651 RepID=UPI003EB72A01
MSDDETPQTTRRKYLTVGGALAASGLIAGCTGGTGSRETTTAGETTTDETTTAGETTTGEQETTAAGESYTVSMPPVGEVTFDGVPETWVANNGSWADMGVALGVEPPKGVWLTSRYHTQYYDAIDGVSVDKSDMVSLYQDGVSKELFYELGGDVHVIDPNFLMNRFKGWEQQDVDEVEQNIGPFFGNSIFSTGYKWHEGYPYLSLYEAFGKLAQVFQRTDRYEAFSALHDEFQTKVSDVVPSSKSERPQVAIMWASGNEPESFSPYLIGEGTSFKQWRDLQVRDAFAETDVKDFHSTRGEIDYETLLKIDPDVLLLRGHESQTAKEFQNTVVSFMKNHDVASSLTAVKNGDVYRGGPLYQGPITNLVLTERAAKQVYGVDEKLFDRQRVADIVNGNF